MQSYHSWHFLCAHILYALARIQKMKLSSLKILSGITAKKKILGVTIDNRFTFSNHIKELCKKASQKISALSRISNQLNDSEKNLLFNAVVKSQFNYCPLVWIFCSKISNNMINKVHERALRVILGDDLSTFESLLQK